MSNKNINRRDFLKVLAGILSGAVILPLRKFLSSKEEGKDLDRSHVREAKYYSAGEDLAG